jgi:hypothetical protein
MADEPIWLELDDVLEIHAAIIGGDAPDPELADWIISLSAGATPEDLALRVREASRPLS